METIRKINDELAIAAGQIAPEQLQQIAQEGFKSVLDLGLPEDGSLSNKQQQVEALGLYYINIPVEEIRDKVAGQVLTQIEQLPKPALVHSDGGTHAALLVLMYIAVQQGATLKQAFQQVEQLGLRKFLTCLPILVPLVGMSTFVRTVAVALVE